MREQCPVCGCVGVVEAIEQVECHDPESLLAWPSQAVEYWCPCCELPFVVEDCTDASN
jgi:hypothetical protein